MQKGSVPNAEDLKREKFLQEVVHLEDQIDEWEKDLAVAKELGMKEEIDDCSEHLKKLRTELDVLLTPLGKYDECRTYLKVTAGEGGTEANDWCRMLAEMYQKYANKIGKAWKICDWSDGTVTGYKSISMELSVPYGTLKGENGVHRLVRVSPFDAKGRRHTSFAAVEILPILDSNESELVKVEPSELRIDTFRSGGPGGQYQNTTESGVRITHLPTGLVAESREERSQLQNRNKAMSRLLAQLALRQEEEQKAEIEAISGPKDQSSFGSQIRSYIFMPYQMVKDERSGYSIGNISAVLNGELDLL